MYRYFRRYVYIVCILRILADLSLLFIDFDWKQMFQYTNATIFDFLPKGKILDHKKILRSSSSNAVTLVCEPCKPVHLL